MSKIRRPHDLQKGIVILNENRNVILLSLLSLLLFASGAVNLIFGWKYYAMSAVFIISGLLLYFGTSLIIFICVRFPEKRLPKILLAVYALFFLVIVIRILYATAICTCSCINCMSGNYSGE